MPNSGLNETAARPITAEPSATGSHCLPVGATDPAPGSGPAATGATGVTVRKLGYVDLPILLSIERRSFSSPWSVSMFALEMSRDSTVALAAVKDERVIGCLILSRFDQAWHLMKVAVAPEERRRGIASLLIDTSFETLADDTPVTLEVRPSNRSAIALYERYGFDSGGLRRGYYPDNGEDALIMWRGDPALAGVPDESPAEGRNGTSPGGRPR